MLDLYFFKNKKQEKAFAEERLSKAETALCRRTFDERHPRLWTCDIVKMLDFTFVQLQALHDARPVRWFVHKERCVKEDAPLILLGYHSDYYIEKNPLPLPCRVFCGDIRMVRDSASKLIFVHPDVAVLFKALVESFDKQTQLNHKQLEEANLTRLNTERALKLLDSMRDDIVELKEESERLIESASKTTHDIAKRLVAELDTQIS